MSHRTFALPSGMRVTVKPMTVAEENILVHASRAKLSELDMARAMMRVFEKTVVSVEGAICPADVRTDDGGVNVRKMCNGDLLHLMVLLRVVSYRNGDELTLREIECTSCKRPIRNAKIRIPDDLFVYVPNGDDLAALREGVPRTVTLETRGGAAHVKIVPDTWKNQEKGYRLMEQHPDRASMCSIRARIGGIVLFDEEGNSVAVPDFEWADWIDGIGGKYPGLTVEEASELRSLIEDGDPAIDDHVLVHCPCGADVEVRVPFDVNFMMVSKPEKKSRRGRVSLGGSPPQS